MHESIICVMVQSMSWEEKESIYIVTVCMAEGAFFRSWLRAVFVLVLTCYMWVDAKFFFFVDRC